MRRLAPILLCLATLAAAAGCGGSTSSSPATSATTTGPTTTSAGGGTTTGPGGQLLRVYFLAGGQLRPVGRTVQATQAVGRAALEQLLAGPTQAEQQKGLTTDVPPGVEIRSLTIAAGLATVDFDPAFAQGAEATIAPRLAQVVYTLTQFPTVRQVAFETGGKPLQGATGGSGELLDGPATRADYEPLAPPILIESPLPNETVTSPLRVTGSAVAFEATIQLEVDDASGKAIADQTVTASLGAPERGSFDVSFPVDGTPGPVTLVAYEQSQKNGEHLHTVKVPLKLGP